jgi:hypothetical protein
MYALPVEWRSSPAAAFRFLRIEQRRNRCDQRARAHPGNRRRGLANYLLKQPRGGQTIQTMIVDDIHKALDAGRVRHAQELFMALRHFLDQHPEARTGVES